MSLRVFIGFFLKGTNNIAFILPLLLELIFIYPFVVVDYLELTWNYYAFLVFYFSIFSFQVALLPLVNIGYKRLSIDIDTKICTGLVFFAVLVYLIGVISNFEIAKILSFNMESYFSIANQSAIERYSGQQKLTIYYKIGSVFAYFSAFSIGFLLALPSQSDRVVSRFKIIALLFLFIAVLDSFLMAARAGMMMLSFCMLSSFFIVKQYLYSGRFVRLSLSLVIKLIITVLSIFLFFLIIQVFRGGKSDFDLLPIINHLMTWFVGHIPAFSNWLKNYELFTVPSFGLNSFAGLADLFGAKNRAIGIYAGTDIGNDRISNIYTGLRPLIEDFSILGVGIIYFMFGLSFIKMFTKNGSLIFIFVNIAVVAYLSWSFVTSIFSYNTILLGYLLFLFVFYNSCNRSKLRVV